MRIRYIFLDIFHDEEYKNSSFRVKINLFYEGKSEANKY